VMSGCTGLSAWRLPPSKCLQPRVSFAAEAERCCQRKQRRGTHLLRVLALHLADADAAMLCAYQHERAAARRLSMEHRVSDSLKCTIRAWQSPPVGSRQPSKRSSCLVHASNMHAQQRIKRRPAKTTQRTTESEKRHTAPDPDKLLQHGFFVLDPIQHLAAEVPAREARRKCLGVLASRGAQALRVCVCPPVLRRVSQLGHGEIYQHLPETRRDCCSLLLTIVRRVAWFQLVKRKGWT